MASRWNLLTKTALFTAITYILTSYFALRLPYSNGYVHLGQVIVLTSCLFLPLRSAIFSSVIGSVLADLLGPGTAHWAIPTLIIKAGMVCIVYLLTKNSRNSLLALLGFILASLFMATGYYVFEAVFLVNSFAAALPSLIALLIEGAVTSAIAFVLFEFYKKKRKL